MKKQILKSALMAVAGVGLFSGVVLASSQQCSDPCCGDTLCENGTYSQYYKVVTDPDDVYMTPGGSTYNYTFDLDSYVGSGWDINAEDQIITGVLTVYAYDDTDLFKEEKANFTYDGGSKTFEVDGIWWWFDSSDVVVTGLLFDHKLDFSISSTKGDFYFAGATIDGKFCDYNPVPEPTTMLLFGAGLAGLAAVGRRRKN